jgi:hypothetical protein
MTQREIEYLCRRAREESRMAKDNPNDAASKAHKQMSRIYRERVRVMANEGP